MDKISCGVKYNCGVEHRACSWGRQEVAKNGTVSKGIGDQIRK